MRIVFNDDGSMDIHVFPQEIDDLKEHMGATPKDRVTDAGFSLYLSLLHGTQVPTSPCYEELLNDGDEQS